MIVKHNLNPLIVVRYMRMPLIIAVGSTITAVAARRIVDSGAVSVPFAPIGTLGAALAIFVAIRNNTSYARWWEARTLLANIQNNSRILGRQLVAATDNAIAAGSGGEPADILAYRRELLLRIVAFAHLLRIALRGTNDWETVQSFLPPEEFARLRSAGNPANLALQALGIRIKDGVRSGIVGQFDPISLEPNLTALNTWATGCERIKNTPTPRQYDYFTRLALAAFCIALPFGLLSIITPSHDVMLIVVSLTVASVFIVLERVGAVLDAPFENATTDVPLSAVCRGIERDLLEQLGEATLPPLAVPVNGYLW